MKRLWVILFVIPLFAQNPCSEEERSKIYNDYMDEVELKKLKEFDDKCREYIAKKMVTIEKQNIKDENQRLKDKISELEKMLDEVSEGYVKSLREIRFLKIELENLKYSSNQQRNYQNTEREQPQSAGKDILLQLLNEYQQYRGIDTPTPTPGLLKKRFCQFDNSPLFTNGETKYGNNLTVYKLYICPGDNSHQFWLED